MEKNPWKTLSTEITYENPWIEVEHNEVINPSGGTGIYGVVRFKNIAIAILPLDNDMNTWIVGQYRYTHDTYEWEIPEGGGHKHLPPLESAKRELLEETGLKAKKWKQILEMKISNSVTDEKSISYIARDLEFVGAEPEETELLEIKKIPFTDVVQMVVDGKITDALSVATILKANYLLEKGLIT